MGRRVLLFCPNSCTELHLTGNVNMVYRANKSCQSGNQRVAVILCGVARCQQGRQGARVWFADWLNRRPTRSESACLSRALARLECNGLVRRMAPRRVRLTPAGQRIAQPYLEDWAIFV